MSASSSSLMRISTGIESASSNWIARNASARSQPPCCRSSPAQSNPARPAASTTSGSGIISQPPIRRGTTAFEPASDVIKTPGLEDRQRVDRAGGAARDLERRDDEQEISLAVASAGGGKRLEIR